MYRAWQKEDAPPSRVKPLPLPVVAQVWTMANADATPLTIAAAQCLVLGFFFLFRLGEYLGVPTSKHGPIFCVRNIQLWVGVRALPLSVPPLTSWPPPSSPLRSPPRKTGSVTKPSVTVAQGTPNCPPSSLWRLGS